MSPEKEPPPGGRRAEANPGSRPPTWDGHGDQDARAGEVPPEGLQDTWLAPASSLSYATYRVARRSRKGRALERASLKGACRRPEVANQKAAQATLPAQTPPNPTRPRHRRPEAPARPLPATWGKWGGRRPGYFSQPADSGTSAPNSALSMVSIYLAAGSMKLLALK